MQTVDIYKIRSGAAKGLGITVHLRDKCLLAAHYMIRKHRSGIVSRVHHHTVHKILYCDHLVGNKISGDRILVHCIQNLLAYGHRIGQRAIFRYDQRG